MLFYILAIAILNLGLGFATATYLARRYRERLSLIDDFPTMPTLPIPSSASSAAMPEEGTREPPSPPSPPSAGSSSGSRVTVSGRERSPGEVSVLDFQEEVQQYHDLLANLDNRLRNFERPPEKEEVSSCLTSLRRANEDYLESRERVCGLFEQLHRERQDFGQIRQHVEAAIGRQSEQITNTSQAIDSFDLEADLGEGCRQLAGETSKLLDVNSQLRDTLDEALVTVARQEDWLAAVEEDERIDPLTGLANRAGLEAALADWWSKDPDRTRLLTAAMLDIDQFTGVNQAHGHKVGNRVLAAVAQLLTAECRSHTVASRYTGQRFLLLFGDVDARFTTNLVERVRQTVELTHLICGDQDIRITISGAVIEGSPDDSAATLVARAEETLQEAKRYGRNRTFLHEGKYPTPVVPPNFTIEERFVTI